MIEKKRKSVHVLMTCYASQSREELRFEKDEHKAVDFSEIGSLLFRIL